MKLSYARNKNTFSKGIDGLPENYPVPSEERDMLFYIQRNQNFNTVVYQLNRNADGFINHDKPLNVYWKEYEEDGSNREINYLQEKLAYGYTHKIINNDTFELSIVSYPSYKLYITKREDKYIVVSRFMGEWALLTNIYVYADDLGAFPDVKYIEFYGEQTDGLPCYEKLNISE